jgi:adenylate kinase family enzyme
VSEERDAFEHRPVRIVVQGASGSGKTTLATALAEKFDAAHLELDGLYQQANWTPLDLEEFRAQVREFVDQPRWVIDGNYRQVRDILWPLATTIVLIDLPKRVVMTRIIKRTFLRIMKREQLWNGNREKWRNAFSRDANHNIILWAWTSYPRYHEEVPREAREVVGPERVVLLTSAADVRRYVAATTLAP